MPSWPRFPTIYEINTWVWLQDLGKKYGTPLTLATLPDEEWDALALLNIDAVWFMGVWERSPAGIAIAMGNPGLLTDFHRALPDFTAADNVGSPYCVRRYAVDARLGGNEGLAVARAALAQRGIRLMLDFVPNHVAPDHPWVTEHPDYFIRGNAEELERDPASYFVAGGQVFACGRDPYFPAWPDVLQLNVFDAGLRAAVVATLSSIAGQCDGVRCDMAMLVMNAIFQRTWGDRAGALPTGEYWPEVIGAVRNSHPGFLFMAEAYWDLEWELQQQGFDFCYDKKLYDRLEHSTVEEIRRHLWADLSYQEKLVRFVENHDEPRAAATFPGDRGKAAAVSVMTLPGAKLLHEGQLEGRKVRLPVFLGRRPDEPSNKDLRGFYLRLLEAVATPPFHDGQWQLCEIEGWPDNRSCDNLIAWCWRAGEERCLVIVNLTGDASQGKVRIPRDDITSGRWKLDDLLGSGSYLRDGDEMRGLGIYVSLPPRGYHLFALTQL